MGSRASVLGQGNSRGDTEHRNRKVYLQLLPSLVKGWSWASIPSTPACRICWPRRRLRQRVIKEQVQGAKGTGVGHQQHPGFAQPEALFWAQEQAPVMDGVAPDCILPMARTPGLAHLVISHLSPECQVLSPITCHLPDCLGGKVHFHILTIPHLVHLNVGHPPAAKWYPEHAQKISHGTGEGWKLGLPSPPPPSSASCLSIVSSPHL